MIRISSFSPFLQCQVLIFPGIEHASSSKVISGQLTLRIKISRLGGIFPKFDGKIIVLINPLADVKILSEKGFGFSMVCRNRLLEQRN